MIIIVDYPITYTYSVATFKPDWDIPAEPLIDDAGENGFPVVSLVVNPIYTPLRRIWRRLWGLDSKRLPV